MPALLFLMRIFEEIDDPYISERIYAVAFGCVVNEDSPQQVRALAEHVYKNIFDKDVVYPNILLRTYAKNIIDYARHIGCVEDGYFDAEKITPPYNSRFPEIPSDEEIKTYKLDYNSESFRDYHWSDAHTFFNNPYYCGLEWVNIDSDHLNCVFPEKVLIPVKQYYSERKGELNSLNSEIASIYWHKPCEEMYTKLQLKYLKGSNSAFVDGAGELVCFESSELIGNDTGFYIRYDKLLEFLKSSSYTLVWTSLCEKRILTPSFGKWDLPPKAIHMSSVYYLKDGKIAKASETLFEDRLYY